jgi:hypothetical protein
MIQPVDRQQTIRNLEAVIAQQIEEVARVVCEDRDAEREVRLLTRLGRLLISFESTELLPHNPREYPVQGINARSRVQVGRQT